MLYEEEKVGKDAGAEPDQVTAKQRSVKKSGGMKNSLLLLRDVLIAVAVLIVILQFYKPTIVFEHSMEDTLHPEDYVFLAKKAYVFGEVEYGDIVVFESKLMDERLRPKSLIKRVVGLPGDIIEIKNENVYRNGERLDEPYTKDGVTPGDLGPVTVPEETLFVLGDNRIVSMDSRVSSVGFVSFDTVSGKVIFRLFPLSKAGVIR